MRTPCTLPQDPPLNSFVVFVVLLFDSLGLQITPPPSPSHRKYMYPAVHPFRSKFFSKIVTYKLYLPGKNFFMAVIIIKFKLIQGYIMNYFNDQLPVGLLTQLIRGLYQYHTGQGLNLSKARIFQAFFLQLLKVHLSM